MKLNAILLPTDFSESSAAALDYASSLASETGATLHVVHVADDSPAYLAEHGGIEYAIDFPSQLKQEIQTRLEQIKPSRDGVKMKRHYLTGSPVEEVVEFSEREKVDLIVMGTHGRTGLSRVLLGSIAEGVLRHANCPILTIKVPSSVGGKTSGETLDDPPTKKLETTEPKPLRTKVSRH